MVSWVGLWDVVLALFCWDWFGPAAVSYFCVFVSPAGDGVRSN